MKTADILSKAVIAIHELANTAVHVLDAIVDTSDALGNLSDSGSRLTEGSLLWLVLLRLILLLIGRLRLSRLCLLIGRLRLLSLD